MLSPPVPLALSAARPSNKTQDTWAVRVVCLSPLLLRLFLLRHDEPDFVFLLVVVDGRQPARLARVHAAHPGLGGSRVAAGTLLALPHASRSYQPERVQPTDARFRSNSEKGNVKIK